MAGAWCGFIRSPQSSDSHNIDWRRAKSHQFSLVSALALDALSPFGSGATKTMNDAEEVDLDAAAIYYLNRIAARESAAVVRITARRSGAISANRSRRANGKIGSHSALAFVRLRLAFPSSDVVAVRFALFLFKRQRALIPNAMRNGRKFNLSIQRQQTNYNANE